MPPGEPPGRNPLDARERYREYAGLRRFGLIAMAIALVLLLVGSAAGLPFAPDIPTPLLLICMGAAMAIFALCAITLYVKSRCPFCRAWLDPRAYPAPGRHCPACGQQVPQDFAER